MADSQEAIGPAEAAGVDDGKETRDAQGQWVPRVLQKAQPFIWPIQTKKLLRFLLGFPGFLWPFGLVAYFGLGALTWYFLQPGSDNLSNFSTLHVSWILPMYVRNLALLLVVAGSLHLMFYWRRVQGTRFKYNSQWPSSNSKAFLFNNQVKDNIFWSLASGVTIWTLYEVLMLWAYGNGLLPFAHLRNNPYWFVGLAVVLPFWQDLHFYITHRISHWKPYYKAAHHVHHRNTNVGPWSGLSMHPLEHILYFTRWIILFFVPSHPIHMFFLMQRPALNPALGHSGFDQIVLDKDTDRTMSIDTYFHYLHHRYFECNYGTATIPLDRWFGTFNDGTPEASERMRRNRRLPPEAA